MPKLVICHAKNYGGIISFMYNFLEYMDVTNEDILLVHPEIQAEVINHIKINYQCSIHFFPNKYLHKNLIIDRYLQARYIRKLRKTLKVDTIYYMDWHIVLDWKGHYDCETFSFVHSYPTRKLPKPLNLIINNVNKNNTVVTVSNFSADFIHRNWHLPRHSIHVLYNFSNLKGSRSVNFIEKQNKRVVTIAHLRDYKNPELWVEIAKTVVKQNDAISFHWYGDGELYDEYKMKTAEFPRITFHGYTNQVEEVLEKETDLYIQTSKIESLGISLLDAMNYSIPILVTNVGGMPELVKQGKNGYICQNEADFVEKIEHILKNKEEYQKFAQSSKENYQNNFSKTSWIDQLNKIIESGDKIK